ncbi:SurA N-terminal domain-containing protein [Mesonia aquimarina]|uniref:SurA N-terminal domain-containing protein n=1 Tax=Mesonia aquimarina TaxID=1504967 RepID=UPI000EF61B00|nr:SurA N-terminal domain-containing protein [Mesonia aquimarina]
MAVLNKIRERSVFLIIIIALALFSFVLADVIRSGGFSSQKSQNTIATVNGEDIEREEFARQVENYQRNARGNMTTTQAVNQVWNSSVRQALLKEQFEELGLEVGQEQINSVLRQQFSGNPNFTNEAGMFDINVMRDYITNLKATSPEAYRQWVNVEENIAEQAKANIYYNLIRAGVGATLAEGEAAYKLENNTVNLKYVLLPYSSIKDVEVSKGEVKDYINKHKEKYQAEASRDLQYVFFEEKASAEDEEAAKAEINKLMDDRTSFNEVSKMDEKVEGFKNASDLQTFLVENSDMPYQERYTFKEDLPKAHAEQIFNLNEGGTYGPYKQNGFWKVSKVTGVKQVADSVKAKDILITFKEAGISQEVTRTKEEAKELADSLLNVIKETPDQFAALAKEYSDDTSTNTNGGDLGWVMYNQVNQDNEVIDYLFGNDEGSKDVVETEMGYYIFSLEEVTDKQKAVKVATLAKQIEPSEKTTSDLYTETTKFEIAAADGDFAKIAEDKSYEVRPVKGVESMQENIPGVGNQRQVIQWAFKEETSVGDIKRFDIPNGYVVAQVTAENKKGLMSVEEASPIVSPIIRNKKKAKMLKEKISGNSLSEIAQAQNVQVQSASAVNMKNPTLPGATREPKVVGAAFSLEKGAISKPVEGKKGVYVVELLSKKEAQPLPNYRGISEQETKRRTAQAVQQVNDALKESAEIKDNRANFY